jgi:hypothetical protein
VSKFSIFRVIAKIWHPKRWKGRQQVPPLHISSDDIRHFVSEELYVWNNMVVHSIPQRYLELVVKLLNVVFFDI